MKIKKSGLFLAQAVILTSASLSMAMPEETLNSRANGAIVKMIQSTNGNLAAVQSYFSKTQVPELDQLWDSRKDIPADACKTPRPHCRVLSVFRGQSSDHPIVLMPGFTGYRKMYLEQIYDLLKAGYGPVYVSDFAGTGDSYKPELTTGSPELTVSQMLNNYKKVIPAFNAEVTKDAGAPIAAVVSYVISQLHIGVGYIPDFNDYQKDADYIMSQAVLENPNHKIVVTSLSMTGLVVAQAIANQDKHPTWITHVDRFVFESPMLRVLASDKLGRGLGAGPQGLAQLGDLFAAQKLVTPDKGLPEFVDKATGAYNPNNSISHSPNRLGLSDSLRVWNGHETAGATLGWGYQELSHQYNLGPLDSNHLFDHPLNHHIDQIAHALRVNHIAVVSVGSLSDGLVDTSATIKFMADLADEDAFDLHMCTVATSRHVMDQESDRYRESYMALVIDQLNHVVRKTYGAEPRNEVLNCRQVLSK
jgi:hypothetical protein